MYNSEGVAVAIVRRELDGRFCATANDNFFERGRAGTARARQ